MYLTTGTAMHEAIDAQAKEEVTHPAEVARGYLDAERVKQAEQYKKQNGFAPWPAEMQKFDDEADFTVKLVEQYFEHYGSQPLAELGLEYIATEVPFKVDISDWIGVPDSYFVGTFDGIASDGENLYLVENKTYSQKPDLQDLQTHFQSTGYAFAWSLLTEIPLVGCVYNGVAKKLIKEPKRLKNGQLSTDVRQQTTLDRYVREMEKDGISLDDPKFEKILTHLSDIERQGDTRFFYRELFYYNEQQLQSWINDFILICNEMSHNPKIYRTIPFNGCGPKGADCWWRDLCYAKHSGQDVDMLIEDRYEVGSYGTIEEVSVDGLETVHVSSLDELKEALRQA
jgi:hypothetical protein